MNCEGHILAGRDRDRHLPIEYCSTNEFIAGLKSWPLSRTIHFQITNRISSGQVKD